MSNTPTRRQVLIDFKSAPAVSQLQQLTGLARRFGGDFESSVQEGNQVFMVFSFDKASEAEAEDFWNYVQMSQDYDNGVIS